MKPVEIKPDIYWVGVLGECYYKNKMWNQAIECYNLVLKIEPENTVIIRQLGLVYEDKGEFNRAIQLYESALKIAPEYTELNRDIDRAYSRKYRY